MHTSKFFLAAPILGLAAVLLLSGCNSSSSSSSSSDDDTTDDEKVEITVGGTLSGLESGSVVLETNAGEELTLSSNGEYSFPVQLESGSSYSISVAEQPGDSQACLLDNASGTAGDTDVTDITLTCERLALEVVPDFGQLTLNWDFSGTANVLLSSDRDCNWQSYGSCDDSQMLADADSGHTLGRSDDLVLHNNYFMVLEAEGVYSPVVASTPWAPGVNGDALSSVVYQDHWYLGGAFSHAAPGTGAGAILSAASGRVQGVIQDVDEQINVVAADGDGGWFITGDFDSVQGEERKNFARIRPDGTVDSEWTFGMEEDYVFAMVVADGKLYVGGEFSEVYRPDGTTEDRQYLAAFDLSTRELTDWSPEPDDYVRTLVANDDRLYIGGDFEEIAIEGTDHDRSGLAAFALSTGDLDSDWTPYVDDTVRALLLHGDTVYAGGDFERAGTDDDSDIDALRVAAFSPADGEHLDTWNGEISNGRVNALAGLGDRVYAGGDFDAGSRDNLIAFATDSGDIASGWSASVDDEVFALIATEEAIVAGGDFFGEAPESAAGFYRNLAAFSPSSGDLLDWNLAPDDEVYTLAVQGDALYVGGYFTAMGGHQRINLAAFNAASGMLTDWNPTADNRVLALAADDGVIYAGGRFEKIGNEDRIRLAAFSADSGDLTDWSPSADDDVNTLLVDAGRLYIGGSFENVGGSERFRLAAVEATGEGDLVSLKTDDEPAVGGAVNAIAINDGKLFVGGSFGGAGNDGGVLMTREKLAAFDLDTGEFDPDWSAEVDGNVYALVVIDDVVYAGGTFNEVVIDGDDNIERTRLAAFDQADGELEPWSRSVSSQVYTLVAAGDRIIAGGRLSTGDASLIAALGLDDDATLLSWPASVGASDISAREVRTLAVVDDVVYVGGRFALADGRSAGRLAAFDLNTGGLLY